MRVFFALVLPAQTSLEIDRWRMLCWPALVRPVPVQNLHVTMAFLGNVSSGQLRALMEEFDDFHMDSIDVRFDELGYWSRPDVLWCGSATRNESLERLAAFCKRKANRIGIKLNEKSFKPHVTLARRLGMPPTAPLVEPDFCVTFEQLYLFESSLHPDGARYRELACFG